MRINKCPSCMHPVSKWRHDSAGLSRLDKVKVLMALSTEERGPAQQDGGLPPRGSPIRAQIILFFFFWLFRAASEAYGRFPGWGLNQSCSHRPTPQPQPHQIRAASVTNTTAHGNAESLTHGARPGIEPATSWFLVDLLTTEPGWELQELSFFKKVKTT